MFCREPCNCWSCWVRVERQLVSSSLTTCCHLAPANCWPVSSWQARESQSPTAIKRNAALKDGAGVFKLTQIRGEVDEFIRQRCRNPTDLVQRDVLGSDRISLRGRRNFHHLRKLPSRDRNKVGRMLLRLRAVIGRGRSQHGLMGVQ